MKKKLLLVTFVALSCVCLALGLTGCHQHTFSEDWSRSETHHWHSATCEHDEEVQDMGEHVAGTPVRTDVRRR